MAKIRPMQMICLPAYYMFFKYLPSSTTPLIGSLCRKLRYIVCKGIFKKMGKNVNVERGASFGLGSNIEIGDNSGIGINARIPDDIIIGNNVMMAPNCYILKMNHNFANTEIPMIAQHNSEKKQTIIEDDVWIGLNVTFTPGRTLKKGSVVAAGCVLCKDFPEYSIIGGNPAKLIRSRK